MEAFEQKIIDNGNIKSRNITNELDLKNFLYETNQCLMGDKEEYILESKKIRARDKHIEKEEFRDIIRQSITKEKFGHNFRKRNWRPNRFQIERFRINDKDLLIKRAQIKHRSAY